MPGKSDPQRRPVLFDLKNQRYLVDPIIGGSYYPIPSPGLTANDIGVTVQAYDPTILKSAQIGVLVQAYDPTILKSAQIGSSIQAYDANTAKLNVAQTWTQSQTLPELRLADGDGSNWIILKAPNTVSSNITVSLPAADGQAGYSLVTNGSNQWRWEERMTTAKAYFFSSF